MQRGIYIYAANIPVVDAILMQALTMQLKSPKDSGHGISENNPRIDHIKNQRDHVKEIMNRLKKQR
jgi:hypothetical protein